MGKKICIIFGFIFFFFSMVGYAETLEVGADKSYRTIASALNNAQNGDTIKVYPGVYKEKVEITKIVTLESVEKHQATIEGDHTKHVITIKSPDVVVNGFKIIASGHNFLDNDAGILVEEAHRAQILNNRMEDILFGIYIDSSNNLVIQNNDITGVKKVKRLSEKGNGIHFFNTKDNLVDGNRIKEVRDGMYFDHGDKTLVTNNVITDLRYGLHYMWSNNNTFRNNYFSNTVSGAAIMFSKVINLDQNIFEGNRGYRAFGMFFQTAEDSIVENNLFLNNSIGIYSDLSRGNIIRKNTVIQNDIGIEILGSNWDDLIYENSFIDNLQQASVNEIKVRDQWFYEGKGNYWSDFTGIDIEKDGIGDSEYHSGSAFEYLMYKYPHLRLFVESPTSKMLKTVDKMFPVLDRAEIVDPFPLTMDLNSSNYGDNLTTNKSKMAGVITFILSLMVVALCFRYIYRLSNRFGS